MAKAKVQLTAEEKERLKKEKAEQKRLNKIAEDIKEATKKVTTLLAKYNKDNFITIKTEQEFDKYISNAIKAGEIAIDTETTGTNVYKDKLVGVCLYSKGQKEAYIPVNHVNYITRERLSGQLDENVVAKHLSRLKDTKVVMHNANFDIRVLRRIGVYLTCWWDTLIAANLLDENEDHGLKPLHQKYVLKNGEDAFSYGKLFSTKIMTFADIPIEIAAIYAAHDALITMELKDFQEFMFTQLPYKNKKFESLIPVYNNIFRDIEMASVNAVCDMEDTGFTFDTAYRDELEIKYMALLQKEEKDLYAQLEKYEKTTKSIKKWRLTDDANRKPAKLGIIESFVSLDALSEEIEKIGKAVELKVVVNSGNAIFNDTYIFSHNDLKNANFTFKLNKKSWDALKKSEKNKLLKAKDTGKYKVTIAKSKSEQLPLEIKDIKLSSPSQLAIILYDIMKCKNKIKDKPRSTGVTALKNINNDFSTELLKYRGFKKLIDAFIISLPKYLADDGKIHCTLNTVGTKTGRYSSSDPNLQQIPSNNTEIRRLFIAPTNYREIEEQDGSLVFKNTEEIELGGKWVFVKDLKVGDKIQNTTIKNIEAVDKLIKIEVI